MSITSIGAGLSAGLSSLTQTSARPASSAQGANASRQIQEVRPHHGHGHGGGKTSASTDTDNATSASTTGTTLNSLV